jgi:hypothetical protein
MRGELTPKKRVEATLISAMFAMLLVSATAPCQAVLMKINVSDLFYYADVVLIREVLSITTYQGASARAYFMVTRPLPSVFPEDL